MTCSNCGKDVPFAGNVCPYCRVDKSKDQGAMIIGMPLALVGAGGAGYLFGFWGAIVGFIAGIWGGMYLAGKVEEMKKIGPKSGG